MGIGPLLYHLPLYILYMYSLAYDVVNLNIGADTYGGKWKFLTFLCLILQTLYFGISTANDLCGSNVRPSHKGHRSRLQRWRDNLLATLVFPVGTFVVLTFWGIYAVDRELVYPKRLDKIIPPWLNHVMHTTVLPFLLVDKFLVYHQYPQRKNGILTLVAFAAAYLTWILWIAYHANIWVYPILKVMDAYQRTLFIAVMLVFFMGIYLLGEAINKFIWRKERAVLHDNTNVKKRS